MNLAHSSSSTFARRTSAVLRIALLVGLCALAPQVAKGQRAPVFALDSLAGYLESSAFSDRIDRKWISSRPHLQDNERGLAEAIQLGVGGSVYHPRLLSWSATGKLTFKQRFLSTQAPDSRREIYDNLRDFRVSTSLLKDHPVTASLFTARTTSDVNGDFQAAINVNRNITGGTIAYSGGRLVQRAGFFRSRYEAEGLIENEEIRRSMQYDATLRLSRLYGSARYEYNNNDFLAGRRTSRGHTARAYATLPIDQAGRSSISSSMVFNSQRSQFLNRYLEGALSVRSALGKGLDGSASVSRRENRTDTVSSHASSVTADLVHHLYQSLTTRLRGEAKFGKFETGNQRDLSPSANADYRKRTFFGSLHLFSDLSYRRYRDDFERTTPTLREREFTYELGVPLIIDERNADTASLDIVNRSRPDQTPLPGIDYSLVPFGDLFEISIPPASSIREGDELLVRYLLLSRGSFELEETSTRHGAGIMLGSFGSFGIEHQKTDRLLLSGISTTSPSDIVVDNLHASFQYAGLRAEGQYQLRRTSVNPYKRRAVSSQWTQPILSSMNIILRSSYVVTDFTDAGERANAVTLSLTFWYKPRRNLVLESRFNNIKRTGRRDEGHDLFWSNRMQYTLQRIELEFRMDVYDRKIDAVGTENRAAGRITIRRSL